MFYKNHTVKIHKNGGKYSAVIFSGGSLVDAVTGVNLPEVVQIVKFAIDFYAA
jgi:hypothetical protein